VAKFIEDLDILAPEQYSASEDLLLLVKQNGAINSFSPLTEDNFFKNRSIRNVSPVEMPQNCYNEEFDVTDLGNDLAAVQIIATGKAVNTHFLIQGAFFGNEDRSLSHRYTHDYLNNKKTKYARYEAGTLSMWVPVVNGKVSYSSTIRYGKLFIVAVS
jgi:hypothetical protein